MPTVGVTGLAPGVLIPARWLRARPVTALTTALAALAVVLIGAVPAAAHGSLLQGSPGPGQVVGGQVDGVDLAFTEPVSRIELTITGPDGPVGGSLNAEAGQIVRFVLDQPLTTPGPYRVDYAFVSADGDPVATGYTFTHDPSAPPPIPLAPVIDDGMSPGWLLVVLPAVVAAVAVVAVLSRRGGRDHQPRAHPQPGGDPVSR